MRPSKTQELVPEVQGEHEELRGTWDEIAAHYYDWGAPLRPSPEDIAKLEERIGRWHGGRDTERVNVFLCGVTPDIATMAWPLPIQLLAMDQAESMVKRVWPGDIPGVRKAVVGRWEKSGLPPRSHDLVIGDGGFGFFDYPGGQRALAAELHRVLRPGGLFIYRHYAQIPKQETMEEVLDRLHSGRIGSFHAFKWHIAMALQRDSQSGVRQHDVWQAVMDAGIERAPISGEGWSRRAMDTIRFYRNKEARLYFPTLVEFRELLSEFFCDIEVVFPTYELGERCPSISACPIV